MNFPGPFATHGLRGDLERTAPHTTGDIDTVPCTAKREPYVPMWRMPDHAPSGYVYLDKGKRAANGVLIPIRRGKLADVQVRAIQAELAALRESGGLEFGLAKAVYVRIGRRYDVSWQTIGAVATGRRSVSVGAP